MLSLTKNDPHSALIVITELDTLVSPQSILDRKSSSVCQISSMCAIVSDCYDKAVSASRGECGLRAASTRLRVKLRVSGCSRRLGHARGLGSENTS